MQEISGTHYGASVQADAIHGDVHLHGSGQLIPLYEELNQVRRQLVESMRAEREITQLVWVLQTVLMRLQNTIARLTRERDQQDAELAEARERQKRTERQLDRAEGERETALRLVEAARAKVLALEDRLQSPVASPVPEMTSVDVGLDMVDQYLDEQGQRLEDLSAAIAEPARAPLEYDELTGLLTRASAEQLLGEWLASPRADHVAVLCVALETPVKDDSLVAHVVERLRLALPDVCRATRLPRGEFLVLCRDVEVLDGIHELAATVRRFVGGRGKAWIGLAQAGSAGGSAGDLIRFADSALLDDKAGRAIPLPEALPHCLEHDLLALEFQPIVDARGAVRMAEAFAYWPHHREGVLPTSVVRSVAAQAGLLRALDEWVLRTASREAAQWPPNFAVAISLTDPFFVGAVGGVIEQVAVPPDRVVVEVQLGVLGGAWEAVRDLRSLGVKIAVDDFGTGYSSLNRLKDLKPDIIKLDRGFITRMNLDRKQFTKARSVVALAEAINCQCVAVGVETRAEFAVLRDLGVDAFQSLLLADPLRAPELRALLAVGSVPVPTG